MFIVFEGIDGSGKTTLSKKLAKKLNYVWTKEPQFGTEKADELNNIKNKEIEREIFFLEDRLKHQNFLKKCKNIVCDRYIWSGISYANLFSKNCYNFIEKLYQNKNIFRQPDLHVFVSPDIKTCKSRRPEADIHILEKLKESYFNTFDVINNIPVLSIKNEDGDNINETIDDIVSVIKKIKYVNSY